jgi:hypothetical protein
MINKEEMLTILNTSGETERKTTVWMVGLLERFQESSSVQTYKQIVWTSKEQNE